MALAVVGFVTGARLGLSWVFVGSLEIGAALSVAGAVTGIVEEGATGVGSTAGAAFGCCASQHSFNKVIMADRALIVL